MARKTAANAAIVCSEACLKNPWGSLIPSGALKFCRNCCNSCGVRLTLPNAKTSHSRQGAVVAFICGEGNGFKRHDSFRSHQHAPGSVRPPAEQIRTSNSLACQLRLGVLKRLASRVQNT